MAHLSSNSRASLRKAFLHFLQTKVISKLWASSWSEVSWWHSAQSNHFRPAGARLASSMVPEHSDSQLDVQQGARMATWALRTCLLRSISGGHRARRGWPRVPHFVAGSGVYDYVAAGGSFYERRGAPLVPVPVSAWARCCCCPGSG